MKRCLIQVILLTIVVCYPIDPNDDEKRPYEFGFTIDGEQHRYEKKDEKGIITGEFGFITADGIYHVTVYATDENGDFKIISMKNIKVGFPPGKTTTTAKPEQRKSLLLNGIMGCGGCLIPETTPRIVPKTPNNKLLVNTKTDNRRNNEAYKGPQPSSNSGYAPQDRFITNDNNNMLKPSYQEHERELKNKQGLQSIATPGSKTSIPIDISDQMHSKSLSGRIPTARNVSELNQITKTFPDRLAPKLIQNQMKSTPENVKLQPGLTEMEMKILDYMAKLYRFNYTLSFHGHEETGDAEGNKNGSYFSNGRDGYQRKVVYIANEFGYQPKISLVKLDDEFIPKEETEKELTKLKGNEFIWFYKKK